MGGVRGGGSMGGAYVAIFFFDFFAFQNRAQGSGRVGRGDNSSPPPWRYPTWYPQEGSDKIQISEIFGVTIFFFDPKKGKNIIFPKSTPKSYLESLEPQLPFYDVFFARFDSCPYW